MPDDHRPLGPLGAAPRRRICPECHGGLRPSKAGFSIQCHVCNGRGYLLRCDGHVVYDHDQDRYVSLGGCGRYLPDSSQFCGKCDVPPMVWGTFRGEGPHR